MATRDFCTRVIQVRFASDPDGSCLHKAGRIRFVAAVLYRPELKRQLATLKSATTRAIELARQIIQRRCYRPPDFDALTSSNCIHARFLGRICRSHSL